MGRITYFPTNTSNAGLAGATNQAINSQASAMGNLANIANRIGEMSNANAQIQQKMLTQQTSTELYNLRNDPDALAAKINEIPAWMDKNQLLASMNANFNLENMQTTAQSRLDAKLATDQLTVNRAEQSTDALQLSRENKVVAEVSTRAALELVDIEDAEAQTKRFEELKSNPNVDVTQVMAAMAKVDSSRTTIKNLQNQLARQKDSEIMEEVNNQIVIAAKSGDYSEALGHMVDFSGSEGFQQMSREGQVGFLVKKQEVTQAQLKIVRDQEYNRHLHDINILFNNLSALSQSELEGILTNYFNENGITDMEYRKGFSSYLADYVAHTPKGNDFANTQEAERLNLAREQYISIIQAEERRELQDYSIVDLSSLVADYRATDAFKMKSVEGGMDKPDAVKKMRALISKYEIDQKVSIPEDVKIYAISMMPETDNGAKISIEQFIPVLKQLYTIKQNNIKNEPQYNAIKGKYKLLYSQAGIMSRQALDNAIQSKVSQ